MRRHISSRTSSIARPRRTSGFAAHGLRAVETVEQLAYRLIANPKEVSDLACTFKVPVPFSMVLQSELEQIRATREWVRDTPDGERTTSMPREPPTGGEPAKEGAPFRQALREDLLGLAFSGGGIRSATFNLGVLQSLAKIGLLKHCDYLSTVSGGGYIGGWFTAWMHRQSGTRKRSDAINDMQRRLSPLRNANPVADAVRPIRYLREYSNYLTPRTGFLSADTWTMIGIFTRNALLNQVILVSLFAGLLLMPRVIVKMAGVGAGLAGPDTGTGPNPVHRGALVFATYDLDQEPPSSRSSWKRRQDGRCRVGQPEPSRPRCRGTHAHLDSVWRRGAVAGCDLVAPASFSGCARRHVPQSGTG